MSNASGLALDRWRRRRLGSRLREPRVVYLDMRASSDDIFAEDDAFRVKARDHFELFDYVLATTN